MKTFASNLFVVLVLLLQIGFTLADPNVRYLIGLVKHDRWVRVAPSASPNLARIKADDRTPKGLAYAWELKPTEHSSRSYEIRNAATGFSITGYDMEGVELTAAPGGGSTWEIVQFHGARFIIYLAGTNLVWTYDHSNKDHGGIDGVVRLRKYGEDTHGQVWTLVADHDDDF
ncbi:hypothetical protein BGW42_004073 [Actinomortierella wolfii]|nr:hypothetical protein BGW42_004073 [Actinomortierella wolfii]